MKALTADLAAVARRMRGERRVALAVHERPDVDALGAAAGMADLFAQLGVEATLHVVDEPELPAADVVLVGVPLATQAPPADTPLYALDSGSVPRLALGLDSWDGPIVNIDHHHDNTRFGELVLLRPTASSTAEVVCDLARALDLTPRPAAAAALYAGISFDSGHFRHASTTAHTLSTAAWLVSLGADPTAIYTALYERRPLGGLRLWARAVAGAREVAGGRALVAVLTLADVAAAGAGEGDTEGVVESLRAVDGVEAAALVKEQSSGPRCRVSLRSSGLDVSAVAAARGGGGHRQAAGFSADDSPEEVTAWLSSELARRLKTASS
ncbi:MAG: DHH family phosphoesterase [Thermoleophilia bacterium]|nr:DHH family phosphoesterase [Thermoleophilia bacterium]